MFIIMSHVGKPDKNKAEIDKSIRVGDYTLDEVVREVSLRR